MSTVYARQAIETRYLGPTNHRKGRVVAKCAAGRHTMPWDHALNITTNHAKAAEILATRLGWEGPAYLGGTKDGYVVVFAAEGTKVAL